MTKVHPPIRRILRRPRFWIPMLLLAVIVVALAYLNGSPWWGWGIVAVLFVAAGWVSVKWLRKPVLLQIGAWVLVTAIIGAIAVLAYPAAQDRPAGGEHPTTTSAVQTKQGPVTGVYSDDRSVEIYAGIPYAQPPVGKLRWAAPQPAKKRTTVFAADRFSDVPIQTTSSFAIRALSKILTIPLKNTFLNPYPASENSLSLTVWRSSTIPASKKLPVLVYIPGGGYVSGSGALPVYDGAALAKRGDVITVTINYRLGVLGFLTDKNLDSQSASGTSGNQGILDQVAALQWVHDNIASFGGNPAHVTIAGESAGGESACILGATPLTKGLIDGIIGESGACMGTAGNTANGDQVDTKKVAESAGEQLSKALGGASIAQMRTMPVNKIVKAASSLSAHWRPSVDGYVLPRSAAEIYERGKQLHVPTLVGNNKDEASLLLASPPNTDPKTYVTEVRKKYGAKANAYLTLYPGHTKAQVLTSRLQAETDQEMTRAMYRWAHLQTSTGNSPTYLYFFTRTPPENKLKKFGAYHGSEVMYAYDNLGKDDNDRYAAADYRLRDQMSSYWLNFITTGNPNGHSLPTWPTVQSAPKSVMNLGVHTQIAPRPRAQAIDFWTAYKGPTS